MIENNFYVYHTARMSEGLSQLGSSPGNCNFSPTKNKTGLCGQIVGEGIYEMGMRKKTLGLTYENRKSNEKVVRKFVPISLALSSIGYSDKETIERLIEFYADDDSEVRRVALISLGLATLGNPNREVELVYDNAIEDKNWRIRAAAGLGYSLTRISDPLHFDRFVEMLDQEKDPYVKVCSCWYISLSHAMTKKGQNRFIELFETGDSFFRDMSCLGLGFSFLGTGNEDVSDFLVRATTDEHPYVRESAHLSLGLTHLGRSATHIEETMDSGLNDISDVTRSGASLGMGLLNYKNKEKEFNIGSCDDPSVVWGLHLSQGLANPNVETEYSKHRNPYIRWGCRLKELFSNSPEKIQPNGSLSSIDEFQSNVNLGMKYSSIQKETVDNLKLIYPGMMYYLTYESFWWGLWMLNGLGCALMNETKRSD